MADRAGGAHIYSQVSGITGNDNWAPRYIDITSSGIDDIPARNRLLENAVGGAVGTYTVAPNSEFLSQAHRQGVTVVASHHSTYAAISSVPGNEAAKLSATRASAEYMKANQGLVELPAGLGGTMVHAKPGVFYYKNQDPTAALFTGNVTNTSTTAQVNYYLATKDRSVVSDVENYFKNISSGKVPNSSEMRDLIITSPTDTKTLIRRVNKAFSTEDPSKPMFIASATLTSASVQEIILNQLKKGGTVKVGESGFVSDPDTQRASEDFLGRLAAVSERLPGKLEIGSAKDDTKKLHLNTVVQGKTFLLSSSRMSNSALSGKGTEASLIGQNERFVQQVEQDLNKFYDFKEVGSKNDLRGLRYNSGFIDFVEQQKTTNNVDIRIPAQLKPKMRQAMLKNGISHSAVNGEVGGILTNAFMEYNSLNLAYSEKDAYRYAFYSNEYGELKSIQQDWFTKTTWGETWGQLGNRGLGATLAIKFAEHLDDAGFSILKNAAEGSAKRFYTYYRAKPVEHSTVLADTVRGGIDYFTNMEMNLLGFHTATTMYSFLFNHGYKVISKSFSFVTGLTSGGEPDSRAGKFFAAAKRGLFGLGYISRYAAADVGMNYMSGIASAIDVLTGATGAGSSQLAVEHTSQGMFAPRGHRDINRRAMLTGLRFTASNPFMRATGVSFMMEFFTNASTFLRTFKSELGFQKNARILKTMLLYEMPEGQELRAFLRNPAGGLKFSWRKAGSLGLFAAVMFDQYTAYLGENMGGIDKLRVDRANEILRNAASTANYAHPVQIARTSNVGMDWTGNKYVDAVKAVSGTLTGTWRSITGFISKLWDATQTMRMTEILGPDIIQKGREMEAAQKAALMGNHRAATAYILLANQGSEGFRNRAFYGDIWRTWVFQASPQPLAYTFTWSMVRHKASDSISGNPEEVEEFGFTLQGPVALKIGISVDLPFRFRKQLKNPGTLDYEPWAFEYKPGSSFVNAIGAVSLLNTLDITFRGGAILSSKIISRSIDAKNPFITGSKAGVLEVFRDVFDEFANHDHRFMVDTNKVGTGGTKLVMHARPGAFRSVTRILAIPVTLPIQAVIMSANMLLGATEQIKWRAIDKIGADKIAEYSTRVGSSQAKSLFGQLWDAHVSSTLWVNHNARAMMRNQLDIQDIETFEKHFGSSTEGMSESQKVEYRAALEHKFHSYKQFISPLLKDMTVRNPWNLISFVQNKHVHVITKGIAAVAHTGLAVLALTPLYFAYEASKGIYSTEQVKASAAYTIGNKLVHWAASASQNQVNALAYEAAGKTHPEYKVTTFYKMVSGIDYVNAPNVLRGLLALIRSGLMLFDTSGHAGIPNIAIALAGTLGEFGVLAAAGGQNNIKFDAVAGRFRVTNSAELYRQNIGTVLTTWATGIMQSFAKGFYHPLGQDQYVMVGSFGITKNKTDKDTEEFAGTFAQQGILMFLTSGYAEKLVLTEGFEQRAYAQWKVTQQLVYSSMGLRMRIRDRQIRTGKMYHDDVLSEATTLGLRTELARRSELFKWIRHVDPIDLAYVPGLVSAAPGSRIPDKISIRRFKDPVTKRQDNLQKVLGFLSNDLVKAGNKPGQMEEYDDQVIFQSALLKNSEYVQKMGGRTPTSLTPENMSFMSGAAFSFVVGSILMLGPLKLLTMGINNKVGRSIYEKARTGAAVALEKAGFADARERLGAIRLAEEEVQLQRLRKLNAPAKMLDIGRGLEAFEYDGNLYSKGERALYGAGIDAEAEIKDPNLRDLRRVFWVGEEFKHGATLPMYRMLNRYVGLSKDFAQFHNMKSMKFSTVYNRLSRLRSSLEIMKSDISGIREALQKLPADPAFAKASEEALEKLGVITKGLEEGFDDINKLTKSLEDMFRHDPKALDQVFRKNNHIMRLLGSQTDINLASELGQIEQKLLLKNMPKELVKILEETGQIKLVGPLKSNAFRNLLEKFGISKKTLDRFRDFSRSNVEYMLGAEGSQMMDSPSRAGVPVVELEFLKTMDESFQRRLMSRFLEELRKSGLETSGKHLMDEIVKVMRDPNARGVGLIEQMMVNAAADPATAELLGFEENVASGNRGNLTKEQLIKFLKALEKAGKLDPKTVETLVNGRLDKIWTSSKLASRAEVLKNFLTGEGVPFRIGSVTFNPSVIGALGRTLQPVFFHMAAISPLQRAAYYSDLLKEPTLRTKDERDAAALQVTENYDHAIAGFGSFIIGGLATSGPVLQKIASFARLLPVIGAGLAGLVEAPGILLGMAISFGAFYVADLGIRFLLNLKSKDTKLQQGYDAQKSKFLSWVSNSINKPIYAFFENASRKLERERYTNKNSESSFWDWAINGDYDPSKYERPTGGMIRSLIDAIYGERASAEVMGSGFSWRRIGGSRSIDPRYSEVTKHSVIWVGNAYDLIRTEIAKQSNLITEGPDSFAHTIMHTSMFGMLAPSKNVGHSKDGTDPIGPAWMRDDYRGQIFRPVSGVSSPALQATLTMRGDFHIQILSNVVDQRIFMANYMTKSPEYDPRSGGGLPPDAYLLSVIDPTRSPLVIAQPKYRHPALNDPDYDKNVGISAYRDAIHPPVSVGRPKEPKSSKKSTGGVKPVKTSVRQSSEPIMSALDIKVDPLLRGLRIAAAKVAKAKAHYLEALESKPNQTNPAVYMVSSTSVKPADPHVLASDTANLQHRRGNLFATRSGELTKSGILLQGHLIHDNYDIELSASIDTACTGTNQMWSDTIG